MTIRDIIINTGQYEAEDGLITPSSSSTSNPVAGVARQTSGPGRFKKVRSKLAKVRQKTLRSFDRLQARRFLT